MDGYTNIHRPIVPPPQLDPMIASHNPRPLLVRFGALGDMAILTVIIRHLHARFGQPVDILASGGWTRPLLQGQPGVGNIYVVRSRNTPYWLSSNQREVVRQLRERGPSATWLCDHYNEKNRRLLHRAGWNEQLWCHYSGMQDLPGPHFCDLYLRFAYRNPPILGGNDLPLTATDAYGQLYVSDIQRNELRHWLQSKEWVDRPLILIQVGNKRTMRKGSRKRASNTKYWPEQNWAEVLRGLRTLHPGHVILMLGVPRETALNDDILQLAGISDAYNVAHELSIPRLVALCECATGMVSVDTGPAHVAAAVGCPVVTLFGKNSPAAYLARGPGIQGIALTGECGGAPSMQAIEAGSVLKAWQELPAGAPRTC